MISLVGTVRGLQAIVICNVCKVYRQIVIDCSRDIDVLDDNPGWRSNVQGWRELHLKKYGGNNCLSKGALVTHVTLDMLCISHIHCTDV